MYISWLISPNCIQICDRNLNLLAEVKEEPDPFTNNAAFGGYVLSPHNLVTFPSIDTSYTYKI